ncbi:unnamed protein product [Linum trigynum]|uniref:Retrotransposon Copia-like N-terminal domain-containing protein n=1 Tax=Linum trigynum TaxID=586398 RepID=A0AAV2GBI6_9ROSI
MASNFSIPSGLEAENPHNGGHQHGSGGISYLGIAISDPASPFFIHPSENWGQCLVSQPLTENNFSNWERSMILVIDGMNKLGFLNATIIAWNELREKFSQGDSFRIVDLQESIFQLKQGTLSVSQYYSKQRALWDPLANFRLILDCECGATCRCILASLRKDHMNDKVIRFLRNLNDNFNAPRSTVMLLDPLPPINKVFEIMVQHERENNLLPKPNFQPNPNPTVDSMAFFTRAAGTNLGIQGANQGFKKQGKKPVCTYCGYTDHTEDICYKKNGYPPGYQPKKKNPPHQANNVTVEHGESSNGGAVMVNPANWMNFQQQY